MNKAEIEAVMGACTAWVGQHHRTTLLVSESSEIRRALSERMRNRFLPAPSTVDLVTLAHKKANEIVSRRRDITELQRVAR